MFQPWKKTFLPSPKKFGRDSTQEAQSSGFSSIGSPVVSIIGPAMKSNRFIVAVIALGALAVAGSVHAVVVGQLDDFEDNTLQGWNNGGAGAPPVQNINTGGPAGVNDNFMEVTSVGGGGPGRFLTVFNRSQWLGDYMAAGVNAIEMDLRNLGTVNLTIRLAFKESTNPGVPGYLSQGIFLPVGGPWQHFVFSITQGTMTAVGGPAAFNTFFSAPGPGEMRLINEAGTGDLNGDVVAGQLGVDNIHAVPEPGVFVLTSVGGLLAFIAARRRKRA